MMCWVRGCLEGAGWVGRISSGWEFCGCDQWVVDSLAFLGMQLDQRRRERAACPSCESAKLAVACVNGFLNYGPYMRAHQQSSSTSAPCDAVTSHWLWVICGRLRALDEVDEYQIADTRVSSEWCVELVAIASQRRQPAVRLTGRNYSWLHARIS